MGQPAAKQGDRIVGMDSHIVVPPSGTPAPSVFPFDGPINNNVSANVRIQGQFAATVGSTGMCTPPHLPKEGTFQVPPTNLGTIVKGSSTVFINNKPAARNGDICNTCNDPVPAPVSKVVSTTTTVFIGG